jgi:hypothetical protein
LDQNINNGDTTAIIFLLKTLGKDRGYYDKSNFDVTSNGKTILPKIEWEDGDTSEL